MSDNFEPKYLLIGCGYTLERVAKQLPIGSFLATIRSEQRAHVLGKLGIPYQICDIADKSAIQKILRDHPSIRVIVDSVPPLPASDSNGWTTGVKNILSSLENTRVERIIYLSTSGVFGVSDGSWVDEKTPPNPDNPKSQARLDCENLYRKSGIPSVSLRIVGIYGLGRGLGLSIKHKRSIDLGPEDRWTNRIHVEDLAAIVQSLLAYPLDLELPEIVCVCDDEPASVKDVLMHYNNLLGINSLNPEVEYSATTSIQSSRSKLNQRVRNTLIKSITKLNLKYPSFRDGAGSEFNIES